MVDTLLSFEKLVDKKSNKSTLKSKPTPLAPKLNYGDLREGEQKSTEQSLETYSTDAVT